MKASEGPQNYITYEYGKRTWSKITGNGLNREDGGEMN